MYDHNFKKLYSWSYFDNRMTVNQLTGLQLILHPEYKVALSIVEWVEKLIVVSFVEEVIGIGLTVPVSLKRSGQFELGPSYS